MNAEFRMPNSFAVIFIAALTLFVSGCSSLLPVPTPTEKPTPIPTTDFFQLIFPTILPTHAPVNVPALWLELELRTPVAYTTPNPSEITTALDGAYVKFDPTIEPPVQCRRCPDWKPEGGIWKIWFDKGIYRIVHHTSGWKSLASFSVSNEHLFLFNDPYCPNDVGEYVWELKNRELVLRVIADPCSMNLRAFNLIDRAWQACTPPNREAAVTGHWQVPEGCE